MYSRNTNSLRHIMYSNYRDSDMLLHTQSNVFIQKIETLMPTPGIYPTSHKKKKTTFPFHNMLNYVKVNKMTNYQKGLSQQEVDEIQIISQSERSSTSVSLSSIAQKILPVKPYLMWRIEVCWSTGEEEMYNSGVWNNLPHCWAAGNVFTGLE